jgi:molybdate transport system substrate-binding protein
MDQFVPTIMATETAEARGLAEPALCLLASTQLRLVLRAWLSRVGAAQPVAAIDYAPSGRLAERIRGGEQADLALFADLTVAQSVLPAGHLAVPFARDRLVLVSRPDLRLTGADLVERLQSRTLRIGSALTDAGQEGDSGATFFAHIDRLHPGIGALLLSRARPLVVRGEAPSHRQVMEMLVSGQMDVVLGSYAGLRTLSQVADVLTPPDALAVDIIAGAAVLAGGGQRRLAAERFVAELRGPAGQAMLKRHGFDPVPQAL